MGGAATGEGGRYIVCDDPHKVGDSDSQRVREQVLDWWSEEMSTRGNDPKTVAKVIVAQRVHEDDLCGHVLKQGGYEHLCLAAEFDGHRSKTSLGWKDPRENDGDLLWEDRFGREELDELKTKARVLRSSRPTPAATGASRWRIVPRFMVEVLV